MLFILYVPRVICSILALKNEKEMFPMYANVRKWSFIFNCVALVAGVLTFIAYDIYMFGGKSYLYILLAVCVSIVYLGMDYHWTNCVTFYNTHPHNRSYDVNWIFSDSEP